jgi:hypothetical protein
MRCSSPPLRFVLPLSVKHTSTQASAAGIVLSAQLPLGHMRERPPFQRHAGRSQARSTLMLSASEEVHTVRGYLAALPQTAPMHDMPGPEPSGALP